MPLLTHGHGSQARLPVRVSTAQHVRRRSKKNLQIDAAHLVDELSIASQQQSTPKLELALAEDVCPAKRHLCRRC